MKITFNGWFDDDMHNTFEQIKRIDAGTKLEKKILEFDEDAKSMTIQGSVAEPYSTTLNACTCADFALRGFPCKHMYCLASKLGMASNLPVYKKKKSLFDAPAEINRYTQLYLDGEINFDVYSKVCNALSRIK